MHDDPSNFPAKVLASYLLEIQHLECTTIYEYYICMDLDV